MAVVKRADRVRQGVDGAEPFLKSRGTHRRGRHHVCACLDIVAISVDPRQILLDQAHAFDRDTLAHRVIMWRTIGFETVRESIHSSAGGDCCRHTDGQFGVANDHCCQQFRMKNNFLFMGD